MTRTISMQVPEGVSEGDLLSFSVDGQEMEIPVPVGTVPGDMLSIQVIGNSDSDTQKVDTPSSNDDNIGVTSFDLGQGRQLQLHSKLPADHRHYKATNSTRGNKASAINNNDEESSDNDCDGTHAMPWSAGLEFARKMEQISFFGDTTKSAPPTKKRILELGSGLGLVGMTFAVFYLLKSPPSETDQVESSVITLSDHPSALHLLQYNLEMNEHIIPSCVQARALEWTVSDERVAGSFSSQKSSQVVVSRDEPPYDCILGADLLYNVTMIPALIATVRRHLHPTKGSMYLAVRWRKPELEREFFKQTSDFLEWSLLAMDTREEGKNRSHTGCTLSWDTFGNPKNEASNLYFHQTMISVQGTPKPLADILEAEMDSFTTQEYEAWEKAHIQIFVGKPVSSKLPSNG